jgi:hypothetical protein
VLVNVDERPEAVSRITSFRPDFIRPQEAKRGAVFAIMVQSNSGYVLRGTNFIALLICHGDKYSRSCLVQCRGTNIGGLDNLSWLSNC